MTQEFAAYRIHSTTRPDVHCGMVTALARVSGLTTDDLKAMTADDLGFYEDNPLFKKRGEERLREIYVLQALVPKPQTDFMMWIDVKPIVPTPGYGTKD